MDFSYWPRLQIRSHTAEVTIESAIANFTGFGGDSIDEQTSELLSSEGSKWVNNNQEVINAEVTKVVVKYVNDVFRVRGNLLRLVFAMLRYDGSGECQ